MKTLNTQEYIERVKKRMQSHEQAKELKRILKESGFSYHLSLYAVIVNPETKHPEYRRIEIYLLEIPKERDVSQIRSFFDSFTVHSIYSVWIYNTYNLKIVQVGSWD